MFCGRFAPLMSRSSCFLGVTHVSPSASLLVKRSLPSGLRNLCGIERQEGAAAAPPSSFLFVPRQSSRRFASKSRDGEPPGESADDFAGPLADWRTVMMSDSEYSEAKKEQRMGKEGEFGNLQTKKRRTKRSRLEAAQLSAVDVTGLQPMLAGTPEETAALLQEAYDRLPKKTGPRRSLHKRRMKLRQWTVRKSHRHAKLQRIAAHERRMAKRSRIARECREMRAECHRQYPEYNKGRMNDPREKIAKMAADAAAKAEAAANGAHVKAHSSSASL